MAAHLDGENGFTYGLVWAPSLFLLPDVDTWQLIINTVRTIVTFLLVAPLQNTLQRADEATQHKLNAVADGLGDTHVPTSRDAATAVRRITTHVVRHHLPMSYRPWPRSSRSTSTKPPRPSPRRSPLHRRFDEPARLTPRADTSAHDHP
jgi:hypothetical protein